MQSFNRPTIQGLIHSCTKIQKACAKAGQFGILNINPSSGKSNFADIQTCYSEFIDELNHLAVRESRYTCISQDLVDAKKVIILQIIEIHGIKCGSPLTHFLFHLSEECIEVACALNLGQFDEFWMEAIDVVASMDLLTAEFNKLQHGNG